MSSVPSVKKNFVLSTAYQILILIVPFITTPYILRVLGADGVGIYCFTNSFALYFTMVPVQSPTLHGEVVFDTDHSYVEILPVIRKNLREERCKRVLKCFSGLRSK